MYREVNELTHKSNYVIKVIRANEIRLVRVVKVALGNRTTRKTWDKYKCKRHGLWKSLDKQVATKLQTYHNVMQHKHGCPGDAYNGMTGEAGFLCPPHTCGI